MFDLGHQLGPKVAVTPPHGVDCGTTVSKIIPASVGLLGTVHQRSMNGHSKMQSYMDLDGISSQRSEECVRILGRILSSD